MASSNHQRVGKALGFLREGMGPFVEREVVAATKQQKGFSVLRGYQDDPMTKDRSVEDWDATLL